MPSEISTGQLATGLLSADTAGRAKMAAGFFGSTELGSHFAAGARPAVCRGAAMTNRLNMATVPANTETVTIGANIYEFRTSTPPAGGTAGRIWVYEGGGVVATARANLVNAINNVVDAPNITYNGTVTNPLVAAVSGADVTVISSAAVGSATVAASTSALACTDGLGAVLDVWDQATMYGGKAENTRSAAVSGVAIVGQMVTQGSVAFPFPFVPTRAIVVDRARPHTEVVTIAGQSVSVTIGGGAAPIAAGDTIDVLAWE